MALTSSLGLLHSSLASSEQKVPTGLTPPSKRPSVDGASASLERRDSPDITYPSHLSIPPDEMLAQIDHFMALLSSRAVASSRISESDGAKSFQGVRFDVSRFAPDVAEILFCRQPKQPYNSARIDEIRLPKLGLAFEVDPRDRLLGFFYPDSAAQAIALGLNGNEIELDYSKLVFPLLAPSCWSCRDYEEVKVYTGQIHPEVIRVIDRVGSSVEPDSSPLCIDLFGGDGWMLYLVAGSSAGESIRKAGGHFLVVDQNEESEKAANLLLRTSSSSSFLRADITGLSSLNEIAEAAPFLVTCIGGLTQGVCSRSDAVRVAKMVFDGVRPGGWFITSGFTASLLNSRDFAKIGFEVVNKVVPRNAMHIIPDFHSTWQSPEQLYILRKPCS